LIDLDEFKKYLSHFQYNLKKNREDGILIKFTDASPYANMIVEYYDISVAPDFETLSFQFDQIGDSLLEVDKEYIGDILVTIIIESLNKLEEQNENRDSNPI